MSARASLAAHYELEAKILNDPSTPLQEGMSDGFLNDIRRAGLAGNHQRYGSDQIVQIDDDDEDDDELGDDDEEGPQASAALRLENRTRSVENDGDISREEETDADGDHVPVLFPHERRAYIFVKASGGHVASNGNGSKSDDSKGTTSMASEDSKGSYVSNGSTSNGYVMSILKQRRSNNPEC